MKKILYYLIDIELQDIDGFKESTGNKSIRGYVIEDNKLVLLFDIEALESDESLAEIRNWLTDNDYGNEGDMFELIQL